MLPQAIANFSPASKVWIYMADRSLNPAEKEELQKELQVFCKQWTAHDKQLKATASLMYDRYVVLIVDETQAGASGCSIDKSVHFLKKAGESLGIDFFGRNMVGVDPWDEAAFIPFTQIPVLLANGRINEETLVADTTVATLSALEEGFVKPLARSWLKRYLKN